MQCRNLGIENPSLKTIPYFLIRLPTLAARVAPEQRPRALLKTALQVSAGLMILMGRLTGPELPRKPSTPARAKCKRRAREVGMHNRLASRSRPSAYEPGEASSRSFRPPGEGLRGSLRTMR